MVVARATGAKATAAEAEDMTEDTEVMGVCTRFKGTYPTLLNPNTASGSSAATRPTVTEVGWSD